MPGVAGLLLAAAPLPGGAQNARETPPRLRAAFNRRSTAVATAGFLAFLAINGVAFLVALRAAQQFGLDTTARGVLLAGFGFAGMLAGRREHPQGSPARALRQGRRLDGGARPGRAVGRPSLLRAAPGAGRLHDMAQHDGL